LVAHVVRFFPEFVALRRAVLDGAIGRPALVRMARLSGYPRGRDDWHVPFDQSGGVLLDMGIHDLDWLLWTFGPAERVYARALDPASRPPYVDYALTTLRLRSGAIAHVESSWAETGGFHTFGEVSGDAGLLTYDSAANPGLTLSLRQPAAAPGVTIPTTYTTESPYVAQMRHFARCIRGEVEPIIAPEEAYEALRVALAALDAARSGQPARLS
jgi:UDP-N-acetylglucosamine 3-dehydrogenase